MIIRDALLDDLPNLIDFGKKIQEIRNDPDMHNDFKTQSMVLKNCMQNGVCIIAHDEDEDIKGVAAGFKTYPLWTKKQIFICQAIWYVLPAFQKTSLYARLLKAYNKAVSASGANKSIMTLEAKPNDAAMIRHGYKYYETIYIRDL